MRLVVALLLPLVLAVSLGGCGSGAGESTPGQATGSPPGSPAASPAASPTAYLTEKFADCFIPRTEAEVDPVTLRGPGMRLPGIRFEPGEGPAPTVLVLLHQTDFDASCGWGDFGTIAALKGFGAVAFDMCGYGDATCRSSRVPPQAQVKLAVDYARNRLKAERIVLVGASMGGSQTVRAVAAGADVDAWADISGPSGWDGVELMSVAGRIDKPGLVAMDAQADGQTSADRARALAKATGAEYVAATGGHGLFLMSDGLTLLPVGEKVLRLAGEEG